MATVVTVVATCCHCKGTTMVVLMEQKCAKIQHRRGGVLEKLKLIVNAAPRWVWLLGMTERTERTCHAPFVLGDISLSYF